MATGRRRSCKRKRAYDTRAAAVTALNSLIARGASHYYMHAYKCRHCTAYHVGHRLGTGGRRR